MKDEVNPWNEQLEIAGDAREDIESVQVCNYTDPARCPICSKKVTK